MGHPKIFLLLCCNDIDVHAVIVDEEAKVASVEAFPNKTIEVYEELFTFYTAIWSIGTLDDRRRDKTSAMREF